MIRGTVRAMVAMLALAAGARCLGAATTRPVSDLWGGENRVVLVGNALVEQERIGGYVEARLLRWNPDRPVTFRNLGWGGDSVTGAARTAGYQRPAGLARLLKEAAELKPTVIVVGYGLLESYDGEAGLARFTAEYGTLLDALGKLAPKLILLSPTFHEALGRPFADPAGHNRDLEKYTAAIAAIAGQRGLRFIDLFHPLVALKRSHPDARLTSNGITLDDAGYWAVAAEVERQLGLGAGACRVDVGADGKVLASGPVDVTPIAGGNDVRFQFRRQNLPAPTVPADLAKAGVQSADLFSLKVNDLAAGRWALLVDGKEVTVADAKEWAAGVALPVDPDQAAADELRRAVVRGGELFYRRSRPFNDHSRHWTYIDGDFALYDEELAEQDKVIAALRRPATHELRLVRKDAVKP